MTLKAYQRSLAEFVYGGDHQALQHHLKAYPDAERQARLQVHQGNTLQSLVNVLNDTYASVVNTIGNDLFRACARAYAKEHPPHDAVLLHYGQQFPDFLAHYPGTADIAYLKDLASVDLLRERSYHAKDQCPLPATRFAECDSDTLIQARIRPIASAHLLRSDYAIFAIWQLAHGEIDRAVTAQTPQAILSIRPDAEVNLYQLDHGLFTFFHALSQHRCIGEALAAAEASDSDFQPTQAITFLIQSGFAAHIDTTGEPS